jgi:serine protease
MENIMNTLLNGLTFTQTVAAATSPAVPSGRRLVGWAVFSLLAGVVTAPALAFQPMSAPVVQRAADADDTDRLVVRYRHATQSDSVDLRTLDSASRAAGRAGARVHHLRRNGSGSHILQLDRRLSKDRLKQLAAEIKAADPQVEFAVPDRIARIQFVPNDPQYSAQWQYHEPTAGMNLPPAWDKSTGVGVTVAVIDTGYRPHADLAANLQAGYDFIGDKLVANDGGGRDTDATDPGDAAKAGECGTGSPATNSSWHGTHVAGSIAAVTGNGTGVAGVAFGAKVLPVRVLGKCGGYMSDIADAIIWASGGSVPGVPANPTPARVLNLSLGASGACDAVTQAAINSARSRNAVVVVAAGNANANASGHAPANCGGVITVGAVGRSGARAYYSNYGAVVDVSAPGGDQSTGTTNGILSTLNAGTSKPGTDSYAYYQGTSMATPHVAGIAALMLARNPALTPDDLEARLKASVRPLAVACSVGCGTGIVDANLAVDAAVGAVTTPTPTPTPTPVTLTAVKEVEPNNAIASAQALSLNVQVSASLASTTDTDYFKVVIPAGKSLVATMTPPATADYDLYAYNAAGSRVATSTAGAGKADTITLSNTSTSASLTAYLRVIYFTGGAGAYSLTVK